MSKPTIQTGTFNDTALARSARDAVEDYRNGDKNVLSTLPPEVRKLAKRLIEEAGLPMEEQKKLRQARTVTLLLDPDQKVAAKGIALSQRESELAEGQKHHVSVYPVGPPAEIPDPKDDLDDNNSS